MVVFKYCKVQKLKNLVIWGISEYWNVWHEKNDSGSRVRCAETLGKQPESRVDKKTEWDFLLCCMPTRWQSILRVHCRWSELSFDLLAGSCKARQSGPILANNSLRHQGYENKPTKRLHLTKYFDVWISQQCYKDFFEQWIKLRIVRRAPNAHIKVKVHPNMLKNKLI